MREFFMNFRKSESGATLVEYGVALILAIVLGATALSNLAGDVSVQMGQASDAMIEP
ncbi:MAG: Flp family type IVb pilin [Boseongicola sp.]